MSIDPIRLLNLTLINRVKKSLALYFTIFYLFVPSIIMRKHKACMHGMFVELSIYHVAEYRHDGGVRGLSPTPVREEDRPRPRRRLRHQRRNGGQSK